MLKNLERIDICCTFALAFAQKSGLRHKGKSSLKDLHRQK